MRRFLLFALLLIPACAAAASPLEEGDRAFRLGDYGAALASYEQAQAEAAGDRDRVAARIEATRFALVLDKARRLLHLEEPHQALEVLALAERMRPGSPQAAELRDRARRKIAQGFTESGWDLYVDEQADVALAAFTQALAFDPDNASAEEGRALAQARLDAREKLGEDYFYLGLEELEAGSEIRAYTAFQHAASFWGEDSRPAELVEEIARRLAGEARARAADYLAMGLVGPAWLELRDAEHLQPGVPEVEEQLAAIEARMLAELDLDSAELALRGGRPDGVRTAVAAALARGAEGIEGRAAELEAAADEAELARLYRRARVCEADGLLVRAVGLLERIAAEEHPGYEDVEPRLEAARARIAAAAGHYRAALEAESAGDRERYLAELRAAVREARDYEDAGRRLRLLAREGGEG
ncbi:MAG: hypothetical protein D6702_00115 [Planctomycetota bacterium]|nr:MAG: hypothetical protein D6702_00115 [Planctomycetota bacterium]